jgi:hypothetical protein
MGLLNRYEKIRMDKDAIPKAESRNRSGGKKRMNRTIRVSAAGDILIMKRLLPGYQDVLPIREFLMQGEVRMANLETTISDGSCYASAYSGGTWLTADAKCLEDTLRYGFNFLGISNNHTMDYSYEGLASTISELKKKDVAYAGAGKNLFPFPSGTRIPSHTASMPSGSAFMATAGIAIGIPPLFRTPSM